MIDVARVLIAYFVSLTRERRRDMIPDTHLNLFWLGDLARYDIK
jgi:hypothetical protein